MNDFTECTECGKEEYCESCATCHACLGAYNLGLVESLLDSGVELESNEKEIGRLKADVAVLLKSIWFNNKLFEREGLDDYKLTVTPLLVSKFGKQFK